MKCEYFLDRPKQGRMKHLGPIFDTSSNTTASLA